MTDRTAANSTVTRGLWRMNPRSPEGRRHHGPGVDPVSENGTTTPAEGLAGPLFEVPVDVDDQVDGGARRLSDEGGQRAAGVEGDHRVVGPVLARDVVDGGCGRHRLPSREEPDVPPDAGRGHGQVDRDGLRGQRNAAVAGDGEGARLLALHDGATDGGAPARVDHPAWREGEEVLGLQGVRVRGGV